ncbi:MAG: cyclic nucleotide-binding domain-containing protein [Deltaproteobacteria bacterium]|nr:cyclic nucleotide-binding domain-containing protein [Deltaproteobacteria bacterium]
MATAKQLRKLKEKLEQLNPTRDAQELVQVLEELVKAEPDNARWPHRLGDTHRKLGDLRGAVVAYEKAVGLYTKAGFITRALAMAKTILSIDSTRVDVLERVDPQEAQKLRPPQRRSMIPSADTGRLLMATVQEAVAKRTADLPIEHETSDDEPGVELRFEDTAVEGSIEIDLSEDEVRQRSDVAVVEEPTAGRLADLPAFPLFADTPKEAMMSLVRAAELVELADGATVVRTGEPSDSMFAIVEGAVTVKVPGLASQPITLMEGDVFGESCLLEREPRRADVAVRGKLVALKIPKAALGQVVHQHPVVGQILFELLTRRLIGNLIQTNALFAAFDLQSRLELARLFEVRRAAKGTILVEAGMKTLGLCLPLTGRVRVQSADGSVWKNRTAASGSMFGQSSLLSHSPSAITVQSMVDMVVLWLPAREFLRVAATYPPALEHLADLAASEPSFAGLS